MPSVNAFGEVDTILTVKRVEAGPVEILVVPDHVKRLDLIIGQNWLNLPTIVFMEGV